jgi:hypothetical protein
LIFHEAEQLGRGRKNMDICEKRIVPDIPAENANDSSRAVLQDIAIYRQGTKRR